MGVDNGDGTWWTTDPLTGSAVHIKDKANETRQAQRMLRRLEEEDEKEPTSEERRRSRRMRRVK